MKKIITTIITIFIIASLIGCGKQEEIPATPSEPVVTEAPAEETEEVEETVELQETEAEDTDSKADEVSGVTVGEKAGNGETETTENAETSSNNVDTSLPYRIDNDGKKVINEAYFESRINDGLTEEEYKQLDKELGDLIDEHYNAYGDDYEFDIEAGKISDKLYEANKKQNPPKSTQGTSSTSQQPVDKNQYITDADRKRQEEVAKMEGHDINDVSPEMQEVLKDFHLHF